MRDPVVRQTDYRSPPNGLVWTIFNKSVPRQTDTYLDIYHPYSKKAEHYLQTMKRIGNKTVWVGILKVRDKRRDKERKTKQVESYSLPKYLIGKNSYE